MGLSLLRSGLRAQSAVVASLLGGLFGGLTPAPTTTTPPASSPTTPPTTPRVESLTAADAPSQVIVRFRPTVTPAQREQVFQDAGLRFGAHLELPGTDMAWLTGNREAALRTLAESPIVEWAEPNTAVEMAVGQTYGQTDPFWPKLWGLENYGDNGGIDNADIDIAAAWSISKGSSAVVGVVDTGADASHPDLAGQLVPGVNFTGDGQAGTADGSGHGTHVTGTIVAAENSIGVIGAAPAGRVMALRALGNDGSGSSAAVASAFAYAGQQGLRVVNASLGSPAPSRAQRDAIAASPNTLFVVAAGNSGVDLDQGTTADYPCEYDLANVVCVGASTRQDGRATFSNQGSTSVDLFAPGQDILSTYPGNTYEYSSGTSMASPHVAAVAALLGIEHPDWTPLRIKAQLMATVDQPSGLRDTSVSQGRVNAARATGLYAGRDGMAPSQVMGLTATPSTSTVDLTWQPATSMDLALYQVEVIKAGAWTEQLVTATESATITGLTPGVPVTMRVRAIDQSGEEGDASATVTSTPGAPMSAASAKSSSAASAVERDARPRGAASAASCGTTGTAGFGSLRRMLSKGAVRGISFRLASPCRVAIVANRTHSKSGTPAPLRTTLALELPAGLSAVKFGSGTSNLRLRPGTWKLTVVAHDTRTSIRVKVR